MIDGSERWIETFLLIGRLKIFRSAEDFETVGDLNAQTQDDTEPQDELESGGHDFLESVSSTAAQFRHLNICELKKNWSDFDFHNFHDLTQLNGTLEKM